MALLNLIKEEKLHFDDLHKRNVVLSEFREKINDFRAEYEYKFSHNNAGGEMEIEFEEDVQFLYETVMKMRDWG